jgi:predicted nucleic acid-binding protein
VILLDTSVLSTVLRRREAGPAERALSDRLGRILLSGERVAVPGVVLQELLSRIREAHPARYYPIIVASVEDHITAADAEPMQSGSGVASIDAHSARPGPRARLFTIDRFAHLPDRGSEASMPPA